MKIIVWLRRDFRLIDNPALYEACKVATEILPVYIHCPEEEFPWQIGGASSWWLHHSLTEFSNSLKKLGSGLTIAKGNSKSTLENIIKETKAEAIYWNRLYDPATIKRDKEIKEYFCSKGLTAKSFSGNLLLEPWELLNSSNKPFQVFTPFWKKLSKSFSAKPLPKISKMPGQLNYKARLKIEDLKLLPDISWDNGFYKTWQPGELGAQNLLNTFSKTNLNNYKDARDIPALSATSKLSPHLHFGEISPVYIWEKLTKEFSKNNKITKEQLDAWFRQLAWRDFACHLLFHFPQTTSEPLRLKFKKFPWKKSKPALRAWQKGLTGYPLIDAGMRELWATGIMHNRVRMATASFLVKHLLQPWQEGSKWFWNTLVDADLANNTMGWQWVAGCGADASPYFRIFNPILQGEKFDPQGEYVKKWIPELKDLDTKWIHKPWMAPKEVLMKANLRLGKNYPLPIVEHSIARERALEAYQSIK